MNLAHTITQNFIQNKLTFPPTLKVKVTMFDGALIIRLLSTLTEMWTASIEMTAVVGKIF
jgi:hypothetical protein